MRISIEIVEEEVLEANDQKRVFYFVYTYLLLSDVERELLSTEHDYKLGELVTWPPYLKRGPYNYQRKQEVDVYLGRFIDGETFFSTKNMSYARAMKKAIYKMLKEVEQILEEQKQGRRITR